MRVLGSLALLSAAFVQGEWTEDMGAELRMLQASNSSNSSSTAGTTTVVSASNSSSAGTPGGSSSSGNTTTNPGTGSSSSGGTSTSGNATTSTTTTSTTTTTTTTTTAAAGNTTTTTTTTGAFTVVNVVTSVSFTVANISAKLAANPTAKAAFKTDLGSAAVTEVCKVSLVSPWTQSACEGDSSYAITVGDGTNANDLRRQLGAHTALDVVKTTVTSSIPSSYETQVKTAVSGSTGSGSTFQSNFEIAAVAAVNANAAALGMNNISSVVLTVVAQSPPASSTTSGATSVSAFFAFAFASAAAALFMF